MVNIACYEKNVFYIIPINVITVLLLISVLFHHCFICNSVLFLADYNFARMYHIAGKHEQENRKD